MQQQTKTTKNQKQEQPELNPSSSPNLYRAANTALYLQHIKILKFATYGLHAVFIVVLVINVILNFDLSKQSLVVEEKATKINEKTYVFADVTRLNGKLAVYEQNITEKNDFASRLKQINNVAAGRLQPEKINITKQHISLTIKFQQAIEISFFINSILQDKAITQIVLNSATYEPLSGEYSAALTIHYD